MGDATTITTATAGDQPSGERDPLASALSALTRVATHRVHVAVFCVTTWIALLWAAIVAGPRLDYFAYMSQWARVLNGENPWLGDPSNTYGAGHQVLALVFFIHPLAPKTLFVLCWFGISLIIFAAVRRNVAIGLATFAVLYGTPLFVILISGYGMGDALVAFLTILAVDLRIRKRQCVLPAAVIAAAVLTKIYPLAILPFLATERGRLDRRFIVFVAVALTVGVFCTVAIWGWSMLNVLTIAVEREGKPLSIFWFFSDSWLSPIARAPVATAMAEWNAAFLAAVMASLYVAHVVAKMRAITGCVLASIVLLACYKVGLPQYFIQSSTLLIYFLAVEWSDHRLQSGTLVMAAASYLAVLNLFELWYLATSGSHRYPEVRAFVGLPCFVSAVFLTWQVMRHERAATQ